MSENIAYRRDVDGLRALAIVPVVLFHAFPSLLPGGFIGVDVFFVISGYLISGIVMQQLLSEQFSIRTFYAHRIRRIFPALILVLLSTFALGWMLAMPEDLERIGKHMATGAGFAQNFALLQESGYFDVASETKPLLHLWSLAIEEQFYLIYPPILWVLWRLRARVSISLTILALASFASSLVWIRYSPTEAFFLPYPRMWELLAGGILAAWSLEQKATPVTPACARRDDGIAAIGLTGIVIGLIAIAKGETFPGWMALVPVVGAVLLLRAGPQAWVNRTVLSHPVAVWIGRISYPLYLWHWPLLAFLHITNSATLLNCALTAGVSVVLAWLTYRLIERPIRPIKAGPAMVSALTVLMILTAYLGINAMQREGMPFRFNGDTILGDRSQPSKIGHMQPGCGLAKNQLEPVLANCWRDARAPARFAITGDSKASALAHGLLQASTTDRPWLMLGGTNSLGSGVPVLTDDPAWAGNQRPLELILSTLEHQPEVKVVVVATAARKLYNLTTDDSIAELRNVPLNVQREAEAGLNRSMDRLIAADKKIALVMDNPTLKDPRRCMSRTLDLQSKRLKTAYTEGPGCQIDLATHLELSRTYRDMLERVRKRHPTRIILLDPVPLLCDLASGICGHALNGLPLYSYTDHISNQASRKLAEAWMPQLITFAQGQETRDSQPHASRTAASK